MTPEISDPAVRAVFAAFPAPARDGLLALRQLIFEIAQDTSAAGVVKESLRWGQPAYLTPVTRTGSTLRLGVPKGAAFALFVHCQSQLIPEFAQAYPGWDRFEGRRAVLFQDRAEIDPLRHGWLIRRALIYHVRPPLTAAD